MPFNTDEKASAPVYARDPAVQFDSHLLTEGSLHKRLHEINKLLFQTIKALSLMMAERDPYTFYHQERMSKVAAAIATEIGLTENDVNIIRLAATVHDIGKIRIPIEILSKPGPIDEFEFGIIKTHPQVGYDILKTIEFPWPIAQIVLQHHERLNGSGYPRGMTGKEILLESKILAVADVVESMASHRPYRPALGVNAALREIAENRDVLYDAFVVDACINLSKKANFTQWDLHL